jgi:hypothetical protein
MPELDVLRVQDVGLAETPDPTILAWAAGEQRILLTHDRETVPGFAYDRIRAGHPMPGVFLVSDQVPKGKAIEQLLLAIECLGIEDCTRYIIFRSDAAGLELAYFFICSKVMGRLIQLAEEGAIARTVRVGEACECYLVGRRPRPT